MTNATRDTDTEAQGRLRDGIDAARESATQVYDRARAKAHDAREAASAAAHRTAQGIEGNPLGILVGGLAVGVLAGALLPRTAREKELLAPLGAKIGEKVRAARTAAEEAGRTQLADLGISRDAAREQVKSLFDGVAKAATSAGSAAAKAATTKSDA